MNGKHTGYCALPIIYSLLCVFLFCTAAPQSTASNGQYYYLQIGTFSVEANAKRLVRQVHGYTSRVVIRGAESASLGWVYTVFVGPFATWSEADAVRIPIRKQGILIEDAFVVATSEPFPGSLPIETKMPDRPVAEEPATPPPAEPAGEPPAEPPPSDEVPEPEVTREEALEPPPAPAAEKKPQPDMATQETKTTPDLRPFRTGRNLGKGVFGLAYSHTYGEYQNQIDSRKSRTSGTTTDIPISTLQGLEFDTTMHRDMLRLRYGVVDRFDIFADVGVAYDESATPKPVFGGGGRFEYLLPFKTSPGGLFVAAQGDFLIGELETEFTSAQGGQWKKESDWYEVNGRLEMGLRFVRWTPYLGGAYSVYREETERQPISGSFTFIDELSEDTPYNVYGGVDIYATKKLLFNIDGRYGTFNSVAGSIQYNFK